VVFNAHPGMVYESNNMFFDDGAGHVIVNNTGNNILAIENFWGTTDTNLIDDYIFDKHDDPSLGFLIYNPLRSTPDTSAPVSPPRGVIIQQIGEDARMKWRQNPESDLLGYRFYFGEFSGYSFLQSSEIIEDTVVLLSDFDATEMIAVTALDKDASRENPQLSGNESPFAFATPMPYAGEDTTVCKTEPFFQITESTIPFDYDSLKWFTSGSGFFADQSARNPIYFPDSSDFENGSVRLIIKVFAGTYQNYDSLMLNFENPPNVFAGNNGLISPDSLFSPQESFALNYHALKWETTGDGIFVDEESLETLYIPGQQDILNESVKLILTATAEFCGAVSDTLHLVIRRQFSAEGRVWAGDVWLAQNPVVAVNMDDPDDGNSGMLRFTNSAGIFRFEGLFEGNYLFFAPADTTIPKSYLPAYHPNSQRWEDAFLHNLKGDTYDLDIHLPENKLYFPDGVGKISGRFILPGISNTVAELFCLSWFGRAANKFCEDGLSNVTIYLYGESEMSIYDFTMTNAAGNFLFSGLPFGRYILKAELAGYESLASEIIELSPETKHVGDVEISIRPQQKVGISVPAHQSEAGGDFVVFPNPASRELFIVGDAFLNLDTPELFIFTSTGMLVLSQKIISNGLSAQIDISRLPAGIYFGLIKRQGAIKKFTFIKSIN